MKPLVAVTLRKREMPTSWDPRTPLFTLADTYVDAVDRAGAIPLLLAHPDPDDVKQVLETVDALLLTGGADIDPVAYGAENEGLSTDCDRTADLAELALARGAAERGMPTFGICRGMQVLNVALGGSMHQHVLRDEGPHRPAPTDHDALRRHGHDLRLEPDSHLAQLLGGTSRWVNSYHHQAIDRVADRLRAVGWAPDGVVEAVEARDGWVCLAVQWHPERTEGSADQALFDALVEAAREGRSALSGRR